MKRNLIALALFPIWILAALYYWQWLAVVLPQAVGSAPIVTTSNIFTVAWWFIAGLLRGMVQAAAWSLPIGILLYGGKRLFNAPTGIHEALK